MQKIIIKEIHDNDYILINKNGTYIKNIEFVSAYKPKVNDVVYLSDEILNEVNLFSFTELNSYSNIKENDLIKIISDKNEYYFIRQYG